MSVSQVSSVHFLMVKGFEVCMGLSLGDFALHVQIQLLQYHFFGIWIVLQMRAGFPDPAYFLS